MKPIHEIFRNTKIYIAASILLFTFTSISGVSVTHQESPPPPAAARQIKVPKPFEKTLANGLRVIVIEDTDVPLVSAQVLIRSGGEVDPANLSGTADMTAALLTKGTKKRSAPEQAQAIEALGGSLNSGAGWDASSASVSVMSSKTAQAIEILADAVRNPTFKQEEIERLRRQYLDNFRVAFRQPSALANYVAMRVIYGDAAYGHPLSGTPESVAQIKREDIVKLHATYYRPDNAVLLVAGDIKSVEAVKLAEKLFGDWAKPDSPLEVRSQDGGTSASKQRVVVIDLPDAGQAAVTIARRGVRRTDPDYFVGLVANSILGGGFSARLNQEIRVKRGLSYGAFSSLAARRGEGAFIASTQTKNESGAEVAALLIAELEKLAKDAVPESEITPRKAALIGGFARGLETTDGMAVQVGSLALHGLNLDQINTYIKNVESVTEDSVRRFAASKLSPSNANIIVVGDSKKFLDELKKRFSEVEVISINELDLNQATLRKSAQKAD
jgi:zinc protease